MRTSSLLAGLLAGVIGSGLWSAPARGQWSITAEVGGDRFWGGSVDDTPEHLSLRPYRPTTFGVGLERRAGRLGTGLKLRCPSPGRARGGGEAVAVVKGIFPVYSAARGLASRLLLGGSAN